MAKITRYNGNLPAFAQAAVGLERTIFGDTAQADDLTSQFSADFLRGWGIVSATENPSREDFNAVSYTLSLICAYLHQMGVPEWNSSQEYFLGSLVSYNGIIYKSRTTNVNSIPSSNDADWRVMIDSGNYQALFDSSFNAKTTTFTRGLLTQSTSASARTTLELGTASTQSDAKYCHRANNLSDLGSASSARSNLGLGSLSTKNSVNNSDWSGTDLSIANGGTGASTAAAAAANLGVPQVGTASNQVRNNSQLDARYLQEVPTTYQEIGSYIMATFRPTTGLPSPGGTTSGSNLYPANGRNDPDDIYGSLTGTWRLMGGIQIGSGVRDSRTSLWVRIS